MTRGMVKSKLMHERKWIIRSQAPLVFYIWIFMVCSSTTKWELAAYCRLRYSLTLDESHDHLEMLRFLSGVLRKWEYHGEKGLNWIRIAYGPPSKVHNYSSYLIWIPHRPNNASIVSSLNISVHVAWLVWQEVKRRTKQDFEYETAKTPVLIPN